MRNELVGNVADYFKYGLLRHLSGRPDEHSAALRLGVVWFLDTRPGNEAAPLNWNYLNDTSGEFEQCDSELFQRIKRFADPELRDVENVASWELLGENALFFSKALPGSHDNAPMKNGLERARIAWSHGALDRTAKADIVYLDPNKGFETKGMTLGQGRSIEFCFFAEAVSYWQRGQSLIVFQARSRKAAQDQIESQKAELQRRLPDARFLTPIYFQHTLGVLFFVVAQPKHASRLRKRLDTFSVKWRQHLRAVGC